MDDKLIKKVEKAYKDGMEAAMQDIAEEIGMKDAEKIVKAYVKTPEFKNSFHSRIVKAFERELPGLIESFVSEMRY